MDALPGGEVEGKVSVVFALFGLASRTQPEQARRQDLADLARRSAASSGWGRGRCSSLSNGSSSFVDCRPGSGLDQPVDSPQPGDRERLQQADRARRFSRNPGI